MEQAFRTVFFRIPGIVKDERKGIYCSVRNPDGTEDLRMERGFQYKGLIPGEDRGGDIRLLTGLEEAVPEFEAILGQRDEEAIRRLNAMRRNPPEDPVLRNALPGRIRVGDRIASATVEEAVVPARGAGEEVPLFNEKGGDGPQGQIPQDSSPCCPSANNHHLGLDLHL